MDKLPEIIPFPNHSTLSFLREYNNFLKTILMKKLKSFTSIGGCPDLVSANSLSKIELTDEICVMINAIITKLPCYNIYSGIVISYLLMKLWSEPYYTHGIRKIISALIDFQKILITCLESMKIEDGSVNVNYFQSLVISILTEEPSVWLERDSLNKLSFEIVKAVLSVTKTESGLSFGIVCVHAQQGEDEFSLVSGVLCAIDDFNIHLVKNNFSQLENFNKIVLFSETLNDMLIIDVIIQNEIKVIFSQKKISDAVKLSLRRKQILFIERGGEYSANCIQLLTGAIPIIDIAKLTADDIAYMIGNFSKIKIVDETKNLISIENVDSNLVSLYIKCRLFTSTTLIKHLVDKCVILIKSVLSSPYYLPGPKLFEKSLSHMLRPSMGDDAVLGDIKTIFLCVLEIISKLYTDHESNNVSYPNESFILKKNALLQALDGVSNVLSLSCVIRGKDSLL